VGFLESFLDFWVIFERVQTTINPFELRDLVLCVSVPSGIDHA